MTPRVIVTSVPPIDAAHDGFEIPAVAVYSERLRTLCAREGCDFVDPYAAVREADRSTARPGATRDGLHMASYRAVQVRLGDLLCPGGDLQPSRVGKASRALR